MYPNDDEPTAAEVRKRRATERRERKNRTGLAQVYICHSTGFSGRLRPAYDAAANQQGELTDREVSRLSAMIASYIEKRVASRKAKAAT